jgi:transglutaminase-like putative cysteine protease
MKSFRSRLKISAASAAVCLCTLLFSSGALHADDFLTDFFSVPFGGKNEGFYDKTRAVLSVSSDDADFTLPETSTQKILNRSVSGKKATVILATGVNHTYAYKPAAADTSATRFLNLSDPKLAAFAQTLKKTSPRETILSVRSAVSSYITDKHSGTPLVSSSQILISRSGDCKQHTVLAVALLRKLGIPARACTGLLYQKEFNGEKNRFAFHMWAEAFDGTSWIICDAAFPLHSVKESHYVALSYHSLKSEAPLDYIGAISRISNLSIDAE